MKASVCGSRGFAHRYAGGFGNDCRGCPAIADIKKRCLRHPPALAFPLLSSYIRHIDIVVIARRPHTSHKPQLRGAVSASPALAGEMMLAERSQSPCGSGYW